MRGKSQTSSVTQSVDLTNKGMGNHYLRNVHGSILSHYIVREWTVSLTYISDQTSKDSENTYVGVCSVVMDFIVLQISHIVLTITGETLDLSITTEKYVNRTGYSRRLLESLHMCISWRQLLYSYCRCRDVILASTDIRLQRGGHVMLTWAGVGQRGRTTLERGICHGDHWYRY